MTHNIGLREATCEGSFISAANIQHTVVNATQAVSTSCNVMTIHNVLQVDRQVKNTQMPSRCVLNWRQKGM